MKQTQREPREDLAKKRREYLRRKAQAQLGAAIALGFAVVFGLLAAYSLLLIVVLWIKGNPAGISYAFCLLIFSFITIVGWHKRQYHTRRAASIPYVPPVHEQIANLQAEEVLLRGSDEPAATPEELLRAAQEGAETASEELLRAESRMV